jgi:hypothetical protein
MISPPGQPVMVEWSAAAVDFTLEEATRLGPAADWAPVTNGLATNVNSYRYTVPANPEPRFYRLRK